MLRVPAAASEGRAQLRVRRLGCPARRQHSPRRPTVIACLAAAAAALAFIASATCFVKLTTGLDSCFIILCKVVTVVFHRNVDGCKRSFCGRLACRTPSNTLALVYVTLQQKTTTSIQALLFIWDSTILLAGVSTICCDLGVVFSRGTRRCAYSTTACWRLACSWAPLVHISGATQ